MMSKEKVDYNNVSLDPEKDVLVPFNSFVAITNLVNAVEREHKKLIQSDKYAYFNRKTHEKLSASGAKKMKKDKLEKEYYENIDLEASRDRKNIRVDRDEIGSGALQILAEFRGIFKHNVDNGNFVEKPQQPQPESLENANKK